MILSDSFSSLFQLMGAGCAVNATGANYDGFLASQCAFCLAAYFSTKVLASKEREVENFIILLCSQHGLKVLSRVCSVFCFSQVIALCVKF